MYTLRPITLWPVGFACLVVVGVCLIGPARRGVSQSTDCGGFIEGTYLGGNTCIQCHTSGPAAGKDDRFVLLTEYATWRLQDKHSLSYLVLKGARAKRIGELLKIEDVAQDASCLSCHAPTPEKKEDGFDFRDGVSCEVCHGPAKDWNVEHQQRSWRVKTAEQKRLKGMADLRDPATCAALCTSCHVGNATEGKVITHAMYAAGHPPLPSFDLALFRQNMPPHWREKRDVPFFKDPRGKDKEPLASAEELRRLYHLETAEYQQTHLLLSGSLVNVRCGLQFVAQRSDVGGAELLPAKEPEKRWPELKIPGFSGEPLTSLWPQVFMGQSECYGCHHELKRRSWRQERNPVGRPGRPQIGAWPLALVSQGIGVGDGTEELRKRTMALEAACDARPFGAPDKVQTAARALSLWAQDRLGKGPGDVNPVSLLQTLCKFDPVGKGPDYPSARQIAAAVWVLSREWGSRSDNEAALRELQDQLAEDFDLRPYWSDRKDRARLILGAVFKPTELGPEKEQLQLISELLTISSHGLPEVSPEREAKVKAALSILRDRSATEAILKDAGPFLVRLDEINERGLAESMRRAASYDPAVFRTRLEKLAGLLPKEKP